MFNYNPNETKNSSIPGIFNGLQIEMYVNFVENLTRYNSYINGMGLVVRIQNNTYNEDQSLYVTRVSAGMSTDLIVERHFKFYLPKPYSNCDSNFEQTELYKLIEKSDINYDQQSCFVQCKE